MSKSVYYIPNGPKNLQPHFVPSFQDIDEYYVELKDSIGTIIATTNMNQCTQPNDDQVRIHFLNRLGTIDSILFELYDISQQVKSDQVEKPTGNPLVKSVHGVGRYNISSNDTLLLRSCDVWEDDLEFYDELFSSPLAWMQWAGIQGQADDYIPIVIKDQKNQKKKAEDRFTYEVSIEVMLSHEKFIIRN
jgi:hypothetical protein